MGRVLALEYSLAKLTEAGIAFIAGWMEDNGYRKDEISHMSALIGFILFAGWTTYHKLRLGAARPEFNEPAVKHKIEITSIKSSTLV